MDILNLLWKIFSFFMAIFTKKDEKRVNAQEYIYNLHLKQRNKAVLSNADFFKLFVDNSNSEEIKIFSKNIPITKKSVNKENSTVRYNKLSKNYLITGEGGCGKSTLLYHHFINSPYVKYLKVPLFFDANDLVNMQEQDFNLIAENLKCLQPKKISLFFDAIDEMGELFLQKREIILNFISKLSAECKVQPTIKVSCRKNFANKFKIRNCFFSKSNGIHFSHYEMSAWSSLDLENIALNILNNTTFKKILAEQGLKSRLQNYKKEILENRHSYFSSKNSFVKTPLLLMLFTYVKIYGNIENFNYLNNFVLFDKFIYSLIETYAKQQDINYSTELANKEISKLAECVFNSYKTSIRILKLDIPQFEAFDCLFKSASKSNEVSFIHAKFYEYFVAKYYYTTITNKNNVQNEEYFKNCFDLLATQFNNDFADMITNAIDTENDNGVFALNFLSIYNEFQKEKYNQLKNKTDYALFKKEIIFRLGRINISDKQILNKVFDFLKLIYHSAENSYNGFLMKRLCAISGSLLGFEEIEIDYVKNMLQNQKDNFYDLVNRSETLIYYGDVVEFLNDAGQKSTLSIDFRDIDINNPINNAKNKRLNRLKQYNGKEYENLLQNYTCSKDDPLKKYRFRLFDMATIYTLLRFHNKQLTAEEKNIIKNCKIDFNLMSEQRKALLTALKSALLSEVIPPQIEL